MESLNIYAISSDDGLDMLGQLLENMDFSNFRLKDMIENLERDNAFEYEERGDIAAILLAEIVSIYKKELEDRFGITFRDKSSILILDNDSLLMILKSLEIIDEQHEIYEIWSEDEDGEDWFSHLERMKSVIDDTLKQNIDILELY
ncbi:hypothetical protein [Metaclostridioides mangenotii]|uniref:hypothetical protein n=1 Tax=Metaclostridioides mangenotii TaxID=1540 RepID=UPI000480AAE2|nr:hypothetical protein [Clostridioides mangenotii]